MRYALRAIKHGQQVTVIEGYNKSLEEVSLADLEKIIEIEQYLEKLLGVRFHIYELAE